MHTGPFSLHRSVAAGLILLFMLLIGTTAHAQAPQPPEREQLLNGLRLMFWLKPGSPDVILKLRINSGAAFDLVKYLASELRIVALLINGERSVADDRDSLVGRRDEILPNEVLVSGKQRNIRHSLKLHIGPRLRVAAAV